MRGWARGRGCSAWRVVRGELGGRRGAKGVVRHGGVAVVPCCEGSRVGDVYPGAVLALGLKEHGTWEGPGRRPNIHASSRNGHNTRRDAVCGGQATAGERMQLQRRRAGLAFLAVLAAAAATGSAQRPRQAACAWVGRRLRGRGHGEHGGAGAAGAAAAPARVHAAVGGDTREGQRGGWEVRGRLRGDGGSGPVAGAPLGAGAHGGR
mmetsp:Transcript_2096/g.5331  ORF Transcript_2096/g.5331 Transcript_2096/m.5331 type:complete len:207 (-) Transcript_2096:2397-3017(-)